MNLYRFKSNLETVVHFISPNLVQIVWSKSFEFGGNCSFCYRQDDMGNLDPLTTAECQEIVNKRSERKLDPNVGSLVPPFDIPR